jgi:hypothetical protein
LGVGDAERRQQQRGCSDAEDGQEVGRAHGQVYDLYVSEARGKRMRTVNNCPYRTVCPASVSFSGLSSFLSASIQVLNFLSDS